jgi:O-acetyl-ADP-ribose deacetylase (regulator of RNase III)
LTITYTTGDATDPQGDGLKIIAHVCNDKGKWGSGFVVALSKRDREPEMCYRHWAENTFYKNGDQEVPFTLGQIQLTHYNPRPMEQADYESRTLVANMIAQRGIRHHSSAPRAVDYDAVHSCLEQVAHIAYLNEASVHMPRIGCGLGGGTWDEIEPIIQNTLTACGIPVTVYDLKGA